MRIKLGREGPNNTWEDNIKVEFEKNRDEGVDFIHLARYRDQWLALLSKIMNIWVQCKVERNLD
jgi:hypothetical protein